MSNMVLRKLFFKDSQYWMSWVLYTLRFWMYQESINGVKYFIVYIWQGSEFIRVLNMPGFIKKTLHHIDAWQSSDYTSGSAYTRDLNIPGLQKVLKRWYIIDAWQDYKYSSGSEHLTVLFDKVLNMTLVLEWQDYRKLCVNFVLEIHSILNMPQVHDDFACIRNLNLLEFHRVYWKGS